MYLLMYVYIYIYIYMCVNIQIDHITFPWYLPIMSPSFFYPSQEDEDEESDEVSDEELQSSYGRRRRSIKGEDLPPRARFLEPIF